MNSAPIDEVVERPAAAPTSHARRSTGPVGHRQGGSALLTEELAGRQASSIRARRKAAGFPTGKTFDIWDGTVSSIPAPTQRALLTLEWGTAPRTSSCADHQAHPRRTSLKRSQAAVDAGHKVSWFSSSTSARSCAASADDTAAKAIRRIMRADVIVIDDIGLLPVTTETAEALYRVVDAAYEKRSIALSSNLHPAGFDELMPKTIANATVDRLLHHAHVVMTAGDSIRLTQATAGKGVTPLTN